MSLDDEELQLDREMQELEDELLKLAKDKRNLELAVQTMQDREKIDQDYFNSK